MLICFMWYFIIINIDNLLVKRKTKNTQNFFKVNKIRYNRQYLIAPALVNIISIHIYIYMYGYYEKKWIN